MAKPFLQDKFNHELLNALEESICIIDHKYTIVYANPSCLLQLGRPADQVIGKAIGDFAPSDNGKAQRNGTGKHPTNLPKTLVCQEGAQLGVEVIAQTNEAGNDNDNLITLRLKPLPATQNQTQAAPKEPLTEDKIFEGIMDATDDIMLVFDAEHRIKKYNQAAAKLIARFYGKSLKKGMNGLKEFGDAAIQTLWQEQHENVLKGKIAHLELPIKAPDGEAFVFDIKMFPIYHNGKIVGKVLNSRDITQKKAKEKELLTITEAIEHAGEAIGITDVEGKLVFMNRRFGELIECFDVKTFQKNGGISGRFVDKELAMQIFAKISAGENWKGEATLTKLTGEEFVARLSSNAIFGENGEVIGLLGTFTDISQEKEQEAFLRLLESSVNKANDIVLITTGRPIDAPDGPKIIYVNEEFERQTGYSREEVIGNTPRLLQGELTSRNELDKIRYALEQWKPIEVELINYRKDGTYFWVNISIFPVGENNGWYTHWVSIQKDITERKLANEKIRLSGLRYQTMTENFPNGYIFLLDRNYSILFTEGRRYFDRNIEPSFLIGKKIHEITPTDELTQLDEHLSMTFLGYRRTFEVTENDSHFLYNTVPVQNSQKPIEEILVFVTDISELKLAQLKLKENEANLKVLIDSSVQATFLLNCNFTILLFNKVAQNLIMLNNGIKLKKDISILNYPFPGSLRHFRQYLTSCMEGVKLNYEYKVTHPISRQNIWYDIQFVPVFNEDGDVTGISLTVVNITHQKISEAKLRKGEATLKAIFDSASQSTLLIDTENKILDFNKVAQRHAEVFWGKELEKGKSILSYLYGGQIKEFQDYFNDCMQGERVKTQLKVKHKNATLYFDMLFLPVYDDQSLIGVSFSALDVTEKVLSEKKIKDYYQQIEHLKYALDASSLLSMSDTEGIITEVNENMVKLSGYSAKELIGSDHRIFKSGYHPKGFFKELWETILAGKIWKGEVKNKAKDGNYYWVQTNIIPLLDDQKKPFQFIVIRNDITEKKLGEEELLSANTMLTKTNEELDQFVYSVSHQLRSPISSVLGLLNIMRMENRGNEHQDKYIKLMEKSMHQLDDTIHEIENYSRNARLYVELENIDLPEVVEHILSSLSFLSSYPKLDIQTEYDLKVPFYTDLHRIKIILSNVISNAIKYYNPSQEHPFVRIKATVSKKSAEISIQDNGLGIENTYLSKIFHMYFRISEHVSGSGLGLYVVQETLDKLGGSIRVTSALDQGSTFIVTIPNGKP